MASAEHVQETAVSASSDTVYFEDLKLSDAVLDALYDMRFDKCTPIQARCIPSILEGRDLIGIAQTGTGKTAAYLLPLLTLLKEKPHEEDAVNCLIMAPTRELAQQIDQALQGFGYYADVRGVSVYGGNDGVRYEQERRSLQAGADIVIATPGRLLTHLDLGTFDLRRTTHLVLDEADRMLDMGFSDDILKIVSYLPKERQTVMFSATMPDKIRQLARSVLHHPVEVRIAVSKPAAGIQQSVYLCCEGDKSALVHHVFAQRTPKRVIVFCASKLKVKELNINLQRTGFNVDAMHSDLEQKQRDDVMQRFKAGRTDILVATDIVARGIDIDDITLVLNYDVPRDAEDYVHRIGRTARAGREGRAVTLVCERDQQYLRTIEELLDEPVPREDLPEGMAVPALQKRGSGGHKKRGRKLGGSRKHAAGRSHPSQAAKTSDSEKKGKRRGRQRHQGRERKKRDS